MNKSVYAEIEKADRVSRGQNKQTKHDYIRASQEARDYSSNISKEIKLSIEQQEALEIVVDTAIEEGLSSLDFAAVAWIESNFIPTAKNPNSSARGVFQFIDSTAVSYGLSEPFNAQSNTDAAVRLWKDNASFLRAKLGREPDGSEMYLAHQQGAGNAVKLLLGGNTPARTIVGNAAVNLNLANQERNHISAREFVSYWKRKFYAAKELFQKEPDVLMEEADKLPTQAAGRAATKGIRQCKDSELLVLSIDSRGDSFDCLIKKKNSVFSQTNGYIVNRRRRYCSGCRIYFLY
ncbi:transglycosylase SLT domain-containing protein [Ruegeria sp. SCPT10]|uniref:transglycosylase SLT domain-containing protein n=1 Tax=Ruegeria sp. SCP10 TaxID=3141377 RepID=UPI00333BAADC